MLNVTSPSRPLSLQDDPGGEGEHSHPGGGDRVPGGQRR